MSVLWRVQDLWTDARAWAKRKLCRHRAAPVYDEVRNDFGDSVYWGAAFSCPLCGETLSVEASMCGEKEALENAAKRGVWR